MRRTGMHECKSMPDALYVIQQGEEGPVKIGRAFDPENRLRSLQAGNPEPLFVVKVWWGQGHRESEAHEHFRGRGRRMMGEWFDATPDDVEAWLKTMPPRHP